MTFERVGSTRPTVVTIAGWAVVIVGILLAAAVALLVLPLVLRPDVDPEDQAKARLLVLAVTGGGIVLAGAQVTLGILILRGSVIARYLLIIFWLLAGVAIQFWAGLPYLIPLLLLAIPVLVLLFTDSAYDWFWEEHPTVLLNAEESVRAFDGPRGALLLIVNLIVVGLFVAAEVSGLNDRSAGVVGIVGGYVLIGYCVVALLLALWALGNDENGLWAGINAVVVVATPFSISLVGFLASIWPLLAAA